MKKKFDDRQTDIRTSITYQVGQIKWGQCSFFIVVIYIFDEFLIILAGENKSSFTHFKTHKN